jgi:hypothetical protein
MTPEANADGEMNEPASPTRMDRLVKLAPEPILIKSI